MGEKYGASKVILWGGIASAVIAVPVFLAIDTANPVLVILRHDRRRVPPCPSLTRCPARP